jgi:hypothetical protein
MQQTGPEPLQVDTQGQNMREKEARMRESQISLLGARRAGVQSANVRLLSAFRVLGGLGRDRLRGGFSRGQQRRGTCSISGKLTW